MTTTQILARTLLADLFTAQKLAHSLLSSTHPEEKIQWNKVMICTNSCFQST